MNVEIPAGGCYNRRMGMVSLDSLGDSFRQRQSPGESSFSVDSTPVLPVTSDTGKVRCGFCFRKLATGTITIPQPDDIADLVAFICDTCRAIYYRTSSNMCNG